MNAALDQKLAQLPSAPGVYIMKDRQGSVVYVGKAVNLRSRVRSYFTRSQDTRAFIPLLDSLLGDIETVLVSNEKEALLLENELIKKHKPRFNVQLRDDKNFLCLRIDLKHPYPRLEMVRRFQDDGARYFGPYASAGSIRETLRVVNRYFQLRTCSDHVLENRRRPCILHQIGRCPAPCVFDIPVEEYRTSVSEAVLFLEGKGEALVQSLESRMKRAATDLRFEDAARLRDQLIALQRSLERQKVASHEPIDQDVFGFHRQADRLSVYALYVRSGRMAGGRSFHFAGLEFPDAELLESFINLYYAGDQLIPDEVLLPIEVEGARALAEILSERKGARVPVRVPARGEKAELVALARQNAEQAFQERTRTKDETLAVLERLQRRLRLNKLPRRIECYDISHFQGATIVASQVAAQDGEADKSRYRRFKIKSVAGQDDFQSMYEVISRRAKRGLAERDLPDLIVIDGGKGQLGSAQAALKDAGVEHQDVVGLAKSRELDDGGDRSAAAERSPERVFVLGRKDPVILPQSSPELFVLTRVRDEAHRFAITFQQKLMRRRNFRSALQDIPGVGEGRKRALLRHFGSLKRIRAASIEALAEVEGMGPSIAERIHGFLHDARAPGEDQVRDASLEDAGPE